MSLRQAAETALAALENNAGELRIEGSVNILREALAQQDRKCEAGPSMQDLWNCWDAVHSGKQEPTAWMDDMGDLTFRTPSVKLRPYWTPLYLHPAPAPAYNSEFERGYDTGFLVGAEKGRTLPIPEGWQLVPTEATKDMSDNFWSAYIPAPDGMAQSCSFEDFHDFRYMYKAMLAAAPKYEEQSK